MPGPVPIGLGILRLGERPPVDQLAATLGELSAVLAL